MAFKVLKEEERYKYQEINTEKVQMKAIAKK